MSKKQLSINLIASNVAFIASLLISFFLTPYLVTTIGKEAYSFYPMANNFSGYFMIITKALNTMASRFITIEITKNNIDKAKTYYSSVFIANIAMMLVLIIPMVLFVIYLELFLDVPKAFLFEIKLLFIMIFSAMNITVISSVFGVSTFAKDRLDLRAGGEIFQGVFKIILYVTIFSIFKPSILFVGIVILVLSISNLIIQVVFTKKLLPEFEISFSCFDGKAVKELLASGSWNSLNALGSMLMLGLSLFLANIFIGPSAAGELAIVQTMPHFISGIITMIFSIFMPRITYAYAMNNKDFLVDEVLFSQKLLGILSTTPIILIMIFGQDFFGLWVPTENSQKLQILSILSLVPLIIHANMWTTYGLNIVLNKVRVPSLILIVSGLLNIVTCILALNFISANIYTILIISGIINILYYLCFVPVYAAMQLKISKLIFIKHILKAILYSLSFILIGVLTHILFEISSWVEFFVIGGIYGIVGIFMNLVIGLTKDERKVVKRSLINFIKIRVMGG